MRLLLNLSLLSPSIALSKEGDITAFSSWDNLKESSQIIWNWIKEHEEALEKVTHISSISGPGGFSSLRVCGLICETLCDKYNAQLNTIRADIVAQQILDNLKIAEPFILNAFGDNVFHPISNDEPLELISVEEAINKWENEVFTGFLPATKKERFETTQNASISPQIILEALDQATQNQPSQNSFIPYYGHPGV